MAEPVRSREDAAIEALRALVRIPTVSRRRPEDVEAGVFARFHAELRARFPLVHERLECTAIGAAGLLFRWAGPSAERPVVLMAHQDVVPVEPDDPWQHDPFGAEVVDGWVWGRGTLDDKGPLVAVCAAVESLLGAGFTPARDVWLFFGCDEEVAGVSARLAVEELRRRGVEPWFVLDEGGAVASGTVPGVAVAQAVIGVAEKGITNVELRVAGRGGHASVPARLGPTARLARAVGRVDAIRHPAHVPDATAEFFRRLAPHAPAPLRPLLRRAGRLRPLLARVLGRLGPESSSMTRTTAVVTTLSGSPALNVVATSAVAGVNVRVMVGDSVDAVLARMRRAVADDQVRFEILDRNEPCPLSPVDDDAFRLLEATVGRVFPDAVTVPYIMMAATDSRHFTAICQRVYRFAPLRMSKEQRAAIHSYDERVGVQDFLDGVEWYRLLLQNLD
ncbi:M20/M25/M40 family metallo-hydrolase [Dactylosporangium vinaceum]|uniref:M20/M25/M40 family metallo-hydrolase n=1 Tax=Dactylosporangium vinaceum TaxID=53362 RepID=A0ABV5ME46_9ACTN|nr:M20/M25/M40 family metallo-hydrolase [Dactylosporangium vinaceum]